MSATRECIYFVEHGKSCRESTDLIQYIIRKPNDSLYVRYYVTCKEHEMILKERNEQEGFLVNVCEDKDKVKQSELKANYKETSQEIILPPLPQQEEGG